MMGDNSVFKIALVDVFDEIDNHKSFLFNKKNKITLGRRFELLQRRIANSSRGYRFRPGFATPATDKIVKSLIKPFFI